jgi:pyruvate dehydrogenase E1 component alpha subunit
MNQGMLLESMNLSAVWNLPVLYVCKDDGWAISTVSQSVTAGDLVTRARGFGMHALDVDGSDVSAVWHAAKDGLHRARDGGGPTFLLARCGRFEGHMLSYPLLRLARQPLREITKIAAPLLRSAFRRNGVSVQNRVAGVAEILSLIRKARREEGFQRRDPVARTRQDLASELSRLEALEAEVAREIQTVVEKALV